MIISEKVDDNPVTDASFRAEQTSRPASRVKQLAFVLAAAVALASAGSHLLVRWLKIETRTGQPWSVGSTNGKPMAFMAGSSLAGDGISWSRVAARIEQRIGGWGVAGASPYEMELLQRRMPEATWTFIVISAYDMNEASLSDFRADVVPAGHALRELVATRASWPYSKRVMTQYFVCWLRKLFPTIGRSRGVMGELRTRIGALLGRKPAESEAGPALALGEGIPEKSYKQARVGDWPEATVIRKVEAMRTAFLNEQSFDGVKKRALQRMIQQGHQQGRVAVVVLPVSPIYAQKFLTGTTGKEFEQSLSELRQSVPQALWVRLDQSTALASNDYFWDLVHMNPDGQALATEELLTALRQAAKP